MNFNTLGFEIAAYNELLCAKEVCVRHCRRCSICGKVIEKGKKCVSAARLVDKLYSKTYRYLLDSGLNTSKFGFVKERHWMHKDCIVIRHPKKKQTKAVKKKNNAYKITDVKIMENIDKLPLDEQLLLLPKAYQNGEITASEYKDLEEAIISDLAFRDAMINEY